ncbi:polysaccharide biosynthesis tyrosine autokinase [Cupriavidus sp. UYPR2.512]|uniref:polysaccharide biosynthesis tyrosine autokinase n=1 Tax=Cupriavidus sp. UYPR2.512 TaxID=1080187 RepID=UPI00037EBB5C|nr:polysaccharide biosynthesis tyrosine autokinase [Cupriavidus sp. UYPR2.512]UIF85834.1 polysaccharide biosynthesis tyrosine autokinase [Cupriavidus necator]
MNAHLHDAQPGVPPAHALAPLLRAHGRWLAAATVSAALAGALYAWSLPPLYQADVLIGAPRGAPMPWLAPRQGGAQAAELDTSMLTSRAVLAPVVHDHGLDVEAAPLRLPWLALLWSWLVRPGSDGLLAAPLPALERYGWGGEQLSVAALAVPAALLDQPLVLVALGGQRYRLLAPDGQQLLEGEAGTLARGGEVSLRLAALVARPDTQFTLTRRDSAAAAAALAGALRIEPARAATWPAREPSGDAAVRIAWRDTDPQRASAVVNAVAASYARTLARQRQEQAARMLDFITAELPRLRAEMEQAETALARHRARAGSLLPSQDAQSYLHGSIEYQRQISTLRLERARLLRRYTPENQEVRAIDDQIEQLRNDRRSLDGRLQGLSEAERDQVSLTRDVKVAEDTYMLLRSQAQMLALARADAGSEALLLDAATPSVAPAGPPRGLITAAAAVLGLLLAWAAALVWQRRAARLASAGTIEAGLALPVICEVMFSTEQRQLAQRNRAAGGTAELSAGGPAGDGVVLTKVPGGISDAGCAGHDQFLLARQHPNALAVEGLRRLRAALQLGLQPRGRRIVALTSARAGEGKTFAAANLAVLAADTGLRVLLVDADLRRGALGGCFGISGSSGLADVLAGGPSLRDAARRTAVPGLWLLGAGTLPSNPSELLSQPRLREVLAEAEARFDLVLVDTPPVLAVADAMLVCHLAGATLLLMRAQETPQALAAQALGQLGRSGAVVVGGVINGVSPRHDKARYADSRALLGGTAGRLHAPALPAPQEACRAVALEGGRS